MLPFPVLYSVYWIVVPVLGAFSIVGASPRFDSCAASGSTNLTLGVGEEWGEKAATRTEQKERKKKVQVA